MLSSQYLSNDWMNHLSTTGLLQPINKLYDNVEQHYQQLVNKLSRVKKAFNVILCLDNIPASTLASRNSHFHPIITPKLHPQLQLVPHWRLTGLNHCGSARSALLEDWQNGFERALMIPATSQGNPDCEVKI